MGQNQFFQCMQKNKQKKSQPYMSGLALDYYSTLQKPNVDCKELVVHEGNTREELTLSGNKDVFKLCLKRDTRHQSD